MAARGKSKQTTGTKGKAFLKSRIEKVNTVLGRLESEFEKAIKGFIAKGEQSSQELRKTFDEMLEWVKNGQIYAIANGTKETLGAEIHKLKTETLAKVKELETVASRNFFAEVRSGLSTLLGKIQDNAVIETVRHRAEKSKDQILEVLNIPNRHQLDHVEQRVLRLEKRLSALSKVSSASTAPAKQRAAA